MSLTVPELAATMQAVLTTTADAAARARGWLRRRRRLTGASFTQALVFGWLQNPQATLEDLAHATATVGTPVSPQALDQRFTAPAADCLRRVLGAAVRHVLAAQRAALPLLRRFHGVSLLDSTTRALPAALAAVWPGCGGRSATAGQAALKVQVRWEVTAGAIDGLTLHAGRDADTAADLPRAPLPRGALRLADLGYFDLGVWRAYDRQGVYWLTRWKHGTALSTPRGRVADLAAWLAGQPGAGVDVPVQVGSRQRLACRLLAQRVPDAVAERRRARVRKDAADKGYRVRPERLALCAWTVLLTNVPADRLAAAEAGVLYRVRWQIEWLFKLWKSQGELDRSRSGRPWRVLCEVYAKLLAMVVQHWLLLVSGGGIGARSLAKTARKARQHALQVASVLGARRQLCGVLRLLRRCLPHGGRIAKRRRRLATYQTLVGSSTPGLT